MNFPNRIKILPEIKIGGVKPNNSVTILSFFGNLAGVNVASIKPTRHEQSYNMS